MPIFEVERDGKVYELEAPDLQSGISAMQPYLGGGMQQASAPGTEPEQSSGRWAPNPLTMAANLPGDALEMGKGIAQTVAHPIEAAKNVYNMGWDGFKDMVYSQYGTWDNFVNYMEQHPASFAMDASMVGGPTGAGLKAAGLAGKAGMVGKVAGAAEKAAGYAAKLDPFAAAAAVGSRALSGSGKAVGGILGITTGTDEAVKYAAEAGYKGALSSDVAGKALDKVGLGAAKGGDEGAAFRSQHKGFSESTAIVDKAKDVMASKKFRESVEHNKALEPVMADPTPLDIKPVRDAIRKHLKAATVVPTGTAKKIVSPSTPDPRMRKVLETIEYFAKGGKKPTGTVATKSGGKRKMTWADLKDAPDTWKMNSFNMMQKEIGKIYGKIPYNDPVRKEIGKIYYAVRDEIDNAYMTSSPNATKYGDTLKASREAQRDAEELVKTFSLQEGTAKDTALRKLYSAMRPNIAHGNFGGRSAMAQALVDAGHKNLMYELAGAHTRPLLKNTLHATIAGTGGYQAISALGASPYFMAALVAYSPKVIGKSAYYSGKVAGSIIKPAVAIEGALRKRMGKAYQPAKKGAQYGTAQLSRVSEAGENAEELKADLISEANKRGYQIHERVLSNLVDKIMSDNPDSYLNGVRAVGRNPRLLKLFEEMGTKGEQ